MDVDESRGRGGSWSIARALHALAHLDAARGSSRRLVVAARAHVDRHGAPTPLAPCCSGRCGWRIHQSAPRGGRWHSRPLRWSACTTSRRPCDDGGAAVHGHLGVGGGSPWRAEGRCAPPGLATQTTVALEPAHGEHHVERRRCFLVSLSAVICTAEDSIAWRTGVLRSRDVCLRPWYVLCSLPLRQFPAPRSAPGRPSARSSGGASV